MNGMNNKQAIYGTAFLLITFAVAFLIYQAFFKSAGSCTDKIMNQGEEGIDCGGECTPCEITELAALRVTKEPTVLSSTSGNVVLFEVLNPNRDYAAKQANYTLTIYESGGRMIEEVSGEISVGALRRTLVLERGVKTFSKSIARIELRLGTPVWEKSFSALFPSLSVYSVPSSTVSGSAIRVTGSVKNDGSSDESGVEIIAIVRDKYGKELYASRTVLSEIPASSARDFTVAFPADESLARSIDPMNTSIVIQKE